MRISRQQFEALVWAAVDALPEAIRNRINNLEIEVQYRPADDLLAELQEDDPGALFGWYEGTPLPERALGYDMTTPDVIYIYQRAHEEACEDMPALRAEVARTVQHELAHHFGIDDDRLDALGAY
jgi:predicted Zn-dependent protease with MMP-like domain